MPPANCHVRKTIGSRCSFGRSLKPVEGMVTLGGHILLPPQEASPDLSVVGPGVAIVRALQVSNGTPTSASELLRVVDEDLIPLLPALDLCRNGRITALVVGRKIGSISL